MDEVVVAQKIELQVKEDISLHEDHSIPVLKVVPNEIQRLRRDTTNTKLVKDRDDQAMLKILQDGGKLYINILDQRVTIDGVSHLNFPFDPKLDHGIGQVMLEIVKDPLVLNSKRICLSRRTEELSPSATGPLPLGRGTSDFGMDRTQMSAFSRCFLQ